MTFMQFQMVNVATGLQVRLILRIREYLWPVGPKVLDPSNDRKDAASGFLNLLFRHSNSLILPVIFVYRDLFQLDEGYQNRLARLQR